MKKRPQFGSQCVVGNLNVDLSSSDCWIARCCRKVSSSELWFPESGKPRTAPAEKENNETLRVVRRVG